MSFQIFVITLNGKTITLDVTPRETVDSLFDRIAERENIPREHFKLLRGGRILRPEKALDQSRIRQESTVRMLLTLSGSRYLGSYMTIKVVTQMKGSDNVLRFFVADPDTTTLRYMLDTLKDQYRLPHGDWKFYQRPVSGQQMPAQEMLLIPLCRHCEEMTITQHGIGDGHWLEMGHRRV